MDVNLYLIDEGMLPLYSPGATLCRRASVGPERGAPTRIAQYAAQQPPPAGGFNGILIVRANESMQQVTQSIWRQWGRYRLNLIRLCGHSSDIEITFGASLRTLADAKAFSEIRRMWVRPGFGNLGQLLAQACIEVHGCAAGNLNVLQHLANYAGVTVLGGTRIVETQGGRVVAMGQEVDPNFAFEGPVRRYISQSPVRPDEFSQL